MKELPIINQILQYLNLSGCYAWRNNNMGVRVGDRWRPAPNRGIADILGITAQGRFIAIEVKSGKYMKPTTEQIVFLENIANKNGVAMVVHSFDEFSLKYREITEV